MIRIIADELGVMKKYPMLDMFTFFHKFRDYDWISTDTLSFVFPKSSYTLRFCYEHNNISQGKRKLTEAYVRTILAQSFWRYLGAA